MYFIVAYCGCVGLIAALAEAGSISMREREREKRRKPEILKNLRFVKKSQ